MSDAPLPPPPSEGFTPPPPPVGFPPPPPPPGAPPPPPGYGAYPTATATPPARTRRRDRSSGLAVALSVLLPIAALANVIFAVALFNRASVLDTDFSGSDLVDADNAVGGGVALVFFAVVPTAIVWIIWQYRHAKNARAPRQDRWARPGVGDRRLVRPHRQLRPAPARARPVGEGVGSRRSRPPGPGARRRVRVVAALRPAGRHQHRLGSLRIRRLGAFTQIDDFQRTDRIAAVGALVSVAAAIAGVVVVRALTARQRRALQGRGLAPGPTPTTF